MRIVVFSGTTEGRDFSRAAAALGIAVTVSVATDLGAEEQGQAPGITVHSGRLLPGAMAELLQGAALCVDATHPYAVEATKNIRAAANAAGVEYHRLLRAASTLPAGSVVLGSAAQAAQYLAATQGNILLTTGAKELAAFAGLDAAKINRVNLARRKFLKPWQEYTMNDRVQWCVAAVPAPSWAAKVFPGIPVEEAMEKLWALIFDVCRVSTGDPVSAWKAHVAEGRRHRDQLNAWNLDHIHMTSSNGTDLTVGLADDATWEGASSKAENGTDFIANVPTEEVFCAPHRERVNGIVYGTKPYVYNGQLIEGWHVTFKDGKVVEHGAEKNASLLAELLSTDENACRIGEIALVPASSPINQSGVLFYNTLFDENAACHIAFGAGYPTNIKGGSKMNRTELLAKGLNDSAIHEDVMIGAPDTNVIGTTKNGKEVTIFTNGEWAF